MFTLTVYARKNQDGFRVVMGEHEKSAFEAGCTTRVYQHSERDGAVDAALHIEQDAAIRTQILRFRSGPASAPPSKKRPTVDALAHLTAEDADIIRNQAANNSLRVPRDQFFRKLIGENDQWQVRRRMFWSIYGTVITVCKEQARSRILGAIRDSVDRRLDYPVAY